MQSGFIYLAVLIILLGLIITASRLLTLRKRKKLGLRLVNSVFLEVMIPRASGESSGEKHDYKESISVAEQIFATLSEIRSNRGVADSGIGATISFEILSINKKISFFINCPLSLRDLLEKQIQAQYPHAQIDEVEPPVLTARSKYLSAVEFGLQKDYVYPIKTYKHMESDPLNALTNSLSKFGHDEAGVIQMVIRPALVGWRARANEKSRAIRRGESYETEPSGIGGRLLSHSVKFLGDAFDQMSSGKKAKSEYGDEKKQKDKPLTQRQEEAIKRLEEKTSKAGFETSIRAVVAAATRETSNAHIRNILSSMMQYTQPPFNGFMGRRRNEGSVLRDYFYRALSHPWGQKIVLNTEELASIFHLPTSTSETPHINWLQSKRAPAPNNITEKGIMLGINRFRGIESDIRLARPDRRRHVYVIGRTGTGKSELLKNMAIQDIEAGEGVAVVDPHGDLIDALLEFVPPSRAEDVILFEPFDLDRPMGLNMLEVKSEEEKDFAVQEMIEIFYKLFPPEIIGPMFEHNMRNVMLTLMADMSSPGTIAEIPRMFTDPQFQKYKISKLADPVVRSFWEQEMAKTSDFHKSEMLGYLISKVGRFVENSMMRNIIGQSRSSFDFRKAMDESKILLVNLSKGKTGEVNSKLLGLIIVSKLQMAVMSRADIHHEARKDFYLYVDEFQNFVTDSVATILSEARKYRLNLIMAHQHISQLVKDNDATLRDSVFGNAGTMISFRIGVEDASILAKEFAPVFNEQDLVNIDRFNAYVKLMVEGTASRPFNMQTLPPRSDGVSERAQSIKNLAKLKHTRPKDEVEEEISARFRLPEPSHNTGPVDPPVGNNEGRLS